MQRREGNGIVGIVSLEQKVPVEGRGNEGALNTSRCKFGISG
jgi:hypothetical protein